MIAGASWSSPRQRAAAAATAGEATADLVQLQCAAPTALAALRMRARPGRIADADQQIAAHMAAAWEPWPQAVTLDTSDGIGAGAAGDPVRTALEAIRPHGHRHVWRPTRPCMLPD